MNIVCCKFLSQNKNSVNRLIRGLIKKSAYFICFNILKSIACVVSIQYFKILYKSGNTACERLSLTARSRLSTAHTVSKLKRSLMSSAHC